MNENLNLHLEHGRFRVMTAYVLTRKLFLSLVLFDGAPFDMDLTQTEDEARAIHAKFETGVKLLSTILDDMPEGPVDRSMLN